MNGSNVKDLLDGYKKAVQVIDIWTDSEFEFYKKLTSSKQKGAFGEAFSKAVLSDMDFIVSKRTSSDQDFQINGIGTEVKTSGAWNQKINRFKWQQIRSQQEYEIIIFLGINPDSYFIGWASKKDLQDNIFGKDEYRQHGGKDGGQELYWIDRSEPWIRDISELRDFVEK